MSNQLKLQNMDPIEIVNKISEYDGDTLIDKMLDYCETEDINIKELGDMLEDFEDFKRLLYKECVNVNLIKNPLLKKELHNTEDLEIW